MPAVPAVNEPRKKMLRTTENARNTISPTRNNIQSPIPYPPYETTRGSVVAEFQREIPLDLHGVRQDAAYADEIRRLHRIDRLSEGAALLN